MAEFRSPIPSFVTIGALAESMKVSKRTIYRWIKSGVLPHPLKVGGSSRFDAKDISDTIERLKNGVPK